MALKGYLDRAEAMEFAGWAHDDSLPGSPTMIDIRINGRAAACVEAGIFRPDLLSSGVGKGFHSFSFNPLEFLDNGVNAVEVFFAGTDQLLPCGRRTLHSLTNVEELRHRSQSRWRLDEPDPSLTWGVLLIGDSFLDEVQRFFQFKADTRILEIGPGYGRLLRTIEHRRLPFAHYLGVDICETRTRKLRRRFSEMPGAAFETGDCATYPYPECDVVLSSIVFERLFPSMRQALSHLSARLKPGTMAFIDFPAIDERLLTAVGYFETGLYQSFLRVYCRDEIVRFFAEAGFRLLEIVHPVIHGLDPLGNDIERALAVAIRLDW